MRRDSPPASRRAFLSTALSLSCAPLLASILRSSWARAGELSAVGAASGSASAPATRFVGIYAPHGIAKELWLPGADFDIGYEHCSLQPFDDPAAYGRSFKRDIVVVEGVDLSAGIRLGTVGHDGARVILTGAAANARTPSLDQFLAVERGLGAVTPHSSLVLGVGDRSTSIGSSLSYDAGGRPLPKRIDPSDVYAAVFASLVVPSDPEGAARFRAERARQKSSLDELGRQMAWLRARVPAHLARSLDQHLTAHRELERRLAHFESACAWPTRPEPFDRVETANGGARSLDAITDLQVDLLAHAMACDLTRFATLFLGDLSRTGLLEDMPNDIHFSVSHRYRGRFVDNPGRPETWLPLARQNRYSYQKVARLLWRLDQHGLLGSTLVLVSSDMGDPARHSSRGVPVLLAGGGIVGGRHLQVGPGQHPANNHLLVSIAAAFGQPIEAFGKAEDPAIVTGGFAGLWA